MSDDAKKLLAPILEERARGVAHEARRLAADIDVAIARFTAGEAGDLSVVPITATELAASIVRLFGTAHMNAGLGGLVRAAAEYDRHVKHEAVDR